MIEHLKHVGKEDHLPDTVHRLLNEHRWPGRELRWMWCHPVVSTLAIIGGLGTLLLYLGY